MTLEEVLYEIGDKVVTDAKSNLKSMNKIASGNLYNSLKAVVEKSQLSFEMASYGKFVDMGRKPGMPKTSSHGQFILGLKAWCKLKGIDTKFAYAIRAAIFKRGIKPTFFFETAYDTNTKDLDAIINRYVGSLLDDIN